MNNIDNFKTISNLSIIEKKEYFNNLFDFYEPLLTEKQCLYFRDYYFSDLSLAEIASNYQVSRNAIFDQLSKVYNLLIEYEDKLGLFKCYKEREAIYSQHSASESAEVQQLISQLRNIE